MVEFFQNIRLFESFRSMGMTIEKLVCLLPKKGFQITINCFEDKNIQNKKLIKTVASENF